MGLILSGDAIDAREAWRLGLVQRVVPRRRLYPEAEALARALAARPSEALRLGKQAVLQGLDMPLGQGLALEERLACLALASGQAKAGLATWRSTSL